MISHGGASSTCSFSSSAVGESTPIVCDIGKLQDSGVDIKGLSRDNKYRLLTTEQNSDPLSYPRTRPCPSSSLYRFKPDWLKQYPWMHYSHFSDGVYCHARVVFFSIPRWWSGSRQVCLGAIPVLDKDYRQSNRACEE